MTSAQIQLCHSLIDEHFGSTVARVASSLLQEGRATVQNLARLTGISVKMIRESLLILLSRQMVSYAYPDIEQSALAASMGIKSLARLKSGALGNYSSVLALDNCWYQLEFDVVLMLVRYPVFATISKELFGNVGHQIVVQLFRYGIVSKDKLIELVGSSDASEVISNMMARRFLVVADSNEFKSLIDQVITNENEEDDKLDNVTKISAVKRKRASVFDDDEIVQSTQKRRAILLQKSKSIKAINISDVNTKAKASNSNADEKQVLRLNFSRFNLHLRSSEVIKYARLFVNDTAASIMDTILKTSIDNESDCLLLRQSNKIAISNILHSLNTGSVKMELPVYGMNSGNTTSERAAALNQYLEALHNSQVGFLAKVDSVGMGGVYKVDFHNIVSHMRFNAIESYIMDRFGEQSMKLFRALTTSKIMDEQGISKLAMVPQKDAREKLFQLFLNGFIEMQEVPRSQDRAPGRTIFCWRSSDGVFENQLQRLYKSILNLRQRRLREKEKIRILLEKTERSDVAADPSLLSNHERNALEKYEQMMQRMISYEIQLDKMIQVLKDF